MRQASGILVSLGATGSLLVAGAGSLLAVSAFVAFDGWPDVAKPGVVARSLVVADPPAVAAPARTPRDETIVLPAPRAAVGPAPGAVPAAPLTPAPVPQPTGPSGSGGAGVGAAKSPEPAPATATPVRPVPRPTVPSPPATPEPAAPAIALVEQTTSVTGDLVRQTGRDAAGAATQVAPAAAPAAAAQAVQEVTDTLGATVSGLGQALGGGPRRP